MFYKYVGYLMIRIYEFQINVIFLNMVSYEIMFNFYMLGSSMKYRILG